MICLIRITMLRMIMMVLANFFKLKLALKDNQYPWLDHLHNLYIPKSSYNHKFHKKNKSLIHH
jgi:hypothetical protein